VFKKFETSCIRKITKSTVAISQIMSIRQIIGDFAIYIVHHFTSYHFFLFDVLKGFLVLFTTSFDPS